MAVRIHGTFGSWILPHGRSVLGRGTGCDVRIDDPRLSRSHARFVVDGYELLVEDLGSCNGVLVDGRRITGSCPLHHGQVVVCGPVVLMVSVDQTQPHPRTPQGGQDPATRRTSHKTDTEAMLEAIQVSAERPSASNRGIDPAILQAIGSPTRQMPPPPDPARVSALQPSIAPGSISSPLEAVRPQPKPPTPRRAPSTSDLEAPELPTTGSGALEGRTHPSQVGADRLLAGAVDGLCAALVALLALGVGLAALAGALVAVGAGLDAGVPSLACGHAASFPDLLSAMLAPGGLRQALAIAPAASAAAPTATIILIGGAALAAVIAVGGLLAVLVVPTVTRGAPRMHRKRGLVIASVADGGPLGYGRALLRWLLAVALWPLAPIAILLGVRAPHDLLSGCMVKRHV